jgi:hypothetical protein
MAMTAALELAYATMAGVHLSAATLAVLTIADPSFMSLAHACSTTNMPVTLMDMTREKSSTG